MKVDRRIFAKNANWSFDKNVPKNFDNHINKSIPLYREFQWLCNEISDYYIKESSIVYDIGCSTGFFLKSLAKRHKAKTRANFIGLDIVKNMTNFARLKNNDRRIDFLNKDILKYSFKKNDFLISFYTIQFIHPKFRQDLINKIYKSLNWGGAFFFVEKVRSYDARSQDQITNIYETFKRRNGFSTSEIFAKRNSLKGILEPFSSNANIQMLKRSGFTDISTVAKLLCFEVFLAIK